MSTTTSTPSTDPESAALDLIVRIAEALPGGAPALRAALQELTGALQLEGALAGLATVADARLVAAAIAGCLHGRRSCRLASVSRRIDPRGLLGRRALRPP